jgi:putative glutamine amidotransferase
MRHAAQSGAFRAILMPMAARVGITDCGSKKIGVYEEALRTVGLEPVRLAAGRPWSLNGLKGLLLTGGADINPKRYRQEIAEKTHPPDDARDEMELDALGAALAADLPVLAICRGMQLLNVRLGGTLIQHLPSSHIHERRLPDEIPGRHRNAHLVEVAGGTQLARIIGAGKHPVNSRHHQAVDLPAAGTIVSARSEDGVPEGMELPSKRFVIAVQWHPEDRIKESQTDLNLFEAFAAACGE